MTRKEQIKSAYKLTGGHASFYDGMMTYSTLPGKAICRIVWNMDREKNLRYIEKALSGIPEDFSGKLLEVPVDRHGQYARPHRDFQQLSGKILRDPRQCLLQIPKVLFAVHVPDDPADRLAGERGIRHHPVIKARIAARQLVSAFDLFFSRHALTAFYIRSRSTARRRPAYIPAQNPTSHPPRSWCSPAGTWQAPVHRVPTPSSACRCRRW